VGGQNEISEEKERVSQDGSCILPCERSNDKGKLPYEEDRTNPAVGREPSHPGDVPM
jgi:hypothetical protein